MVPQGQQSTSAVTQKSIPSYTYSVKIVPKKKAEYVVQKLHGITKRFDTIEELKQAVNEACQGKVSLENFGYIEPGRGVKGKQRWLACSEDLEELYMKFTKVKRRSCYGAMLPITLLGNGHTPLI